MEEVRLPGFGRCETLGYMSADINMLHHFETCFCTLTYVFATMTYVFAALTYVIVALTYVFAALTYVFSVSLNYVDPCLQPLATDE